MTRFLATLLVVLTFAALALSNDSKVEPDLRLLLSEVQPGAMSSEQNCMLVFSDRTFHIEKANRRLGQDRDRRVSEGQLSEADWNTLLAILDSKDLVSLKVQPTATPLVIENAHSYAISVARDKRFQNMEFMDDKSRKPYDSQLKPLLQWWKSMRGRRMDKSEAPADQRCALDSSRGVFAY